jgi:hypothetical protein
MGKGCHETWGAVAIGRVQEQRSSGGREIFHRGGLPDAIFDGFLRKEGEAILPESDDQMASMVGCCERGTIGDLTGHHRGLLVTLREGWPKQACFSCRGVTRTKHLSATNSCTQIAGWLAPSSPVRSGLCRIFFQRFYEFVSLFLRNFPGDSVALLNDSDELLPASVDDIQIVVRQLSPFFSCLTFELFPFAFDMIPVHSLASLGRCCFCGRTIPHSTVSALRTSDLSIVNIIDPAPRIRWSIDSQGEDSRTEWGAEKVFEIARVQTTKQKSETIPCRLFLLE